VSGCSEGSGIAQELSDIANRVFRNEESPSRRRKQDIYKIQPYISHFTPTMGPANSSTILEIQGINFFSVPRVQVGIYDATVTFYNQTCVRVVTMTQPEGLGDLIVYCGNGRCSVIRAAFQFYEGSPPTPVITAIDPPEIPWGFGISVAVNGMGFRENAKVYFNGIESNDVFVATCSQVFARTPFAGTGPATVTLINPDGGCASVTTMFTYADWTDQNISGNILARRQYGLAEDNASGLLVAFGGYQKGYADGYAEVNMTWTFDGTAYYRDGDAPEPDPARFDFALASNPGGGVVLFGGLSGSTQLSDTWIYSGGNWSMASPADSPGPRMNCRAVFDPVQNRTVLFGGVQGFFLMNDTWVWNGSQWTRIGTANSPPPLRRFAMAPDETGGGVFIFGGETMFGPSGETWFFDGSDWTFISGAGPAPRVSPAMAFNPNTGDIILFGGTSGLTAYGDTWLLDPAGGTWIQAAPATSPSARADAAMAADHGGNSVILHGGHRQPDGQLIIENDTWEWNGSNWNNVTPQLGP
jgi:hypothetical protein